MKSHLAGALILPLALGACGSAKLQQNPALHRDEAQAQKLVQSCVGHGSLFTHRGRQKIIACLAPPGQEAALQRCSTKALAHDGVLTKAQRQRFEGDLAQCVLKVKR